MMQPFNPVVYQQSGVAGTGDSAQILRFTGKKRLGTEKKGFLWQSKGAHTFGRSVKLYVGRRNELASKLGQQIDTEKRVVTQLGLNNRSVKVVDSKQCQSLLQHYQESPLGKIQQAEIALLEAVINDDEIGVGTALENIKTTFQTLFPDSWQEKYQAFMQSESQEILLLSQQHSNRGALARLLLGKPRHKKAMAALDRKIADQQAELEQLKQQQRARHTRKGFHGRQMPSPRLDSDIKTQQEKPLHRRKSAFVSEVPVTRMHRQTPSKAAGAPVGHVASRQPSEGENIRAFQLMFGRLGHRYQLEGNEYDMAKGQGMLTPERVFGILGSDQQLAAHYMEQLATDVQYNKMVAVVPDDKPQPVTGRQAQYVHNTEVAITPESQKLAFQIVQSCAGGISDEDFELALNAGLLNDEAVAGLLSEHRLNEATQNFLAAFFELKQQAEVAPVPKQSENTGTEEQRQAFEVARKYKSQIAPEDLALALDNDLLNPDMVGYLLSSDNDLKTMGVQEFGRALESLWDAAGTRKKTRVRGVLFEPVTDGTSPVMAGNRSLMLKLVNVEKDFDGNPLVTSEDEFNRLFGRIPHGAVDDGMVVETLRHFRKLQKYQGMISVRFTPEMYHLLLRENGLERDVTEMDFTGMDELTIAELGTPEKRAELRGNGLITAFYTVGKYLDVVPEKTGMDAISEAGLKPHASGLYNWRNNCFINASLQVVSAQLASPEAFQAVQNYQPAGHTPQQLELYQQFQHSFLSLCAAINDRQREPALLVNLQRRFMQNYLSYSQATGRKSAAFILDSANSNDIRPGNISQQDPHEFLNDLADIFGLNTHPDCSVEVYEHKTMVHNEQEKLTRTLATGDRLALLPISMRRQGAETVDRCVAEHLAPEQLNEFNRYQWSEADLTAAGLAKNAKPETVKKIQFTSAGAKPPGQLMLQMKIFEYQRGKANKLNEEAKSLMANGSETVSLPIATNASEEGVELVPYSIKGIVCHRGDSTTSGHYVGLRFENGKVIVCDDDVVLELNDYARFRKLEPFKNWQDFCVKEKFSGYLFSLEKKK